MKRLVIRLDSLYLLHLALERLVRQHCDLFVDHERSAMLIRSLIVKKMPAEAGKDAEDIMVKTIAESIPTERNCLVFTLTEEGITLGSGIVEEQSPEQTIMLPQTPDSAEEGDADHEEAVEKKLNEFLDQQKV